MRGVIVAGLFFFCALFASGQELRVIEGGFAPGMANFGVTFRFSDMAASYMSKPVELTVPGLAAPVQKWSGGHGATAQLEICCLKQPVGLGEGTLAAARLRVANPTDRPVTTALVVAIAPQGVIHALAFERHAFFIEGKPVLVADAPSRGAILADSPFAPRPLTPQDQAHVESAKGECRGEMLYDLTLAPGQTQVLGFIAPVRLPTGTEPGLDFYRAFSVDELFAQAQKQAAAR